MSWYRAPLWDLRPDITSCRNVAVWNLWFCIYWAPSLTRGRVCNLQYNHWIVRIAQKPKPYFTSSSDTPPMWRANFSYLYPPATGWPSYTPEHCLPFTSSLTTRLFKTEYSYYKKSSSFLAGTTLCHRYRDQPVNAIYKFVTMAYLVYLPIVE
jgi:hypothetical protein